MRGRHWSLGVDAVAAAAVAVVAVVAAVAAAAAAAAAGVVQGGEKPLPAVGLAHPPAQWG